MSGRIAKLQRREASQKAWAVGSTTDLPKRRCSDLRGTTALMPYYHSRQAMSGSYLLKSKLALEVNEQPAVAEEVVEAGLLFHEGMHWGVQLLHQIPQGQ